MFCWYSDFHFCQISKKLRHQKLANITNFDFCVLKVLQCRLSTFLEENKILNETQSGFREEYSPITLHSLIEYFKKQKVNFTAVLLTLGKPFTVYEGMVCGKKYLHMAYKAKHLI